MYHSSYQSLKPVIMEILGLSKDAIHIYVGYTALVVSLLVLKKRRLSMMLLIPGFLLSIIMECLDLWGDYELRGHLHLLASLHDILNTNFIPVVTMILLTRYPR